MTGPSGNVGGMIQMTLSGWLDILSLVFSDRVGEVKAEAEGKYVYCYEIIKLPSISSDITLVNTNSKHRKVTVRWPLGRRYVVVNTWQYEVAVQYAVTRGSRRQGGTDMWISMYQLEYPREKVSINWKTPIHLNFQSTRTRQERIVLGESDKLVSQLEDMDLSWQPDIREVDNWYWPMTIRVLPVFSAGSWTKGSTQYHWFRSCLSS